MKIDDFTLNQIHGLMVLCQLQGNSEIVTVLAVLSEAIRGGWADELAEIVSTHHYKRKEEE